MHRKRRVEHEKIRGGEEKGLMSATIGCGR